MAKVKLQRLPWHMLRYGIAREARYIVDHWADLDVLVFAANSVAHMPKAIATFVGERGIDAFLIDPLTHSFQHPPTFLINPDTRRIKSSVDKLATAYGGVSRDKAGREPVLPEDFRDETEIRTLVANVLQFQINTIRGHLDKEGVNEYLEYAGLGDRARPAALVAPYFYMQATTIDDWADVNRRLLKEAASHSDGFSLLAELVIDRDVLVNDDHVATLLDVYSGDLGHDGVLLWVDNFSEDSASLQELTGFRRLAVGLRDSGTPVLNLYGGYLSMALCTAAGDRILAGVCHGLEYGEDRAVVPVGGGIPTAKFYLPALHKRMRYQEAIRAVRGPGWLTTPDVYFQNVCNCGSCRRLIGMDPNVGFFSYGRTTTKRDRNGRAREYPLPQTRENTLNHYLEAKAAEWDFLSQASREEVIDGLLRAHSELRRHVGLDEVAHLEIWVEFLRGL